ncbi:unnamed protein product [Lasius platythorax]|uniref:Uncharacterized protein n=1 Tax=Lasius platythorax TaxID=488582 RepID=A0AAV2MZV0_9HYME
MALSSAHSCVSGHNLTLQPEVPVTPAPMIPDTEEETLEKLVEVPELSQAQQAPEAESSMELIPEEHPEHDPNKENPDQQRREDAVPIQDDVGEQANTEEDQQTPPVMLKYRL